MDDIIKELNEVGLELNWGSVDRIDGMPKNVAVVQRAIAELEKYKRAFDLACREVASYSVCIWCDDEDIDCDNCKRLQATREKFLKWAVGEDE